MANPNIAEAGKKTRFTSENARAMQAKSADARKMYAKRREIFLSQANLTPESKKFWAKFGFEGDKAAYITNDMKATEKGLKSAIENGEIDKIIRLFKSRGLDFESLQTEEAEETNQPIEFVFNRVGNGS